MKRPFTKSVLRNLDIKPVAWLIFVPALLGPNPCRIRAEPPVLVLRAVDLDALPSRPAGDYEPAQFEPLLAGGTLVAFEDNRVFAYAAGAISLSNRPASAGVQTEILAGSLRRQILLIKPGTIVIDDRLEVPGTATLPTWRIDSDQSPLLEGRLARIPAPSGEIFCETVLPERARAAVGPVSEREKESGLSGLAVTSAEPSTAGRFLHVLQVRPRGEQTAPGVPKLLLENGRSILAVTLADRTFRWTLSSEKEESGHVEMSGAPGVPGMERRLLPAGVLPHGPKGRQLLDRWDRAYQRGQPAPWDTGRPSGELKRAVESGVIRPGRALELGCGSGRNAIYLAQKGFDVAAIDIAPTALLLAEEKALEAGIRVRWMLADVLAPPKLDPFDLIFDRGCYHGVRRQSASVYVDVLRRLCRPGTRVLVLAGNANETPPHYGPPRVKEEELREDFGRDFEFEWLRVIHFDVPNPAEHGALAWSILLRRKENP